MTRDEAAKVLGLSAAASSAEVDVAFRRFARRAHPDHGGDPRAFGAAVEARRVLRGRSPAAVGTARPARIVVTTRRSRWEAALRRRKRWLDVRRGRARPRVQ